MMSHAQMASPSPDDRDARRRAGRGQVGPAAAGCLGQQQAELAVVGNLQAEAQLGAALIRIDPRDRAGLEWAKNRARFWLTGLKRRRKHLPRGEPYSEAEAAAIRALVALEEAAGQLLMEDAERQQDITQGV